MNSWPEEHRRAVGKLLKAASADKNLSPLQIAHLMDRRDFRQVQRAFAGDEKVSERYYFAVARVLGVDAASVAPPRPPAELDQLGRIEAMLCALLDAQGIAHDEAVRQFVALGEREVQRRAGQSGPSGVRPVAADDADEESS